jgi:ATP-dependent Lhr-like helicase
MVENLKFSAALPEATAIKTLSQRFADRAGAAAVAAERKTRMTDRVDT